MSHARRHSRTPSFLRRKTFAFLGLSCLAFLVYGSLAPFHFRDLSIEKAVIDFQLLLDNPLQVPSRSDAVINVLLLIPAAFFLMGAMGVDRPSRFALGDAVLVLPVCLFTSVAVEFAQQWVPNRTASVEDILAQVVGTFLGAGLWVAVGQQVTDWARWVWKPSEPVGLDARLLPAYLFLLAFVHLAPFDLSPSPVEWYRKYKQGLVNLVPFVNLAQDHYSYLQGRLISGLYFFLLGVLLPGLPWTFWRDWREAGRVFGWTFALVASITGLKLLVATRGFDVTDVLVGTLLAYVGWLISMGVRRTSSDSGWWWTVRLGSCFGLLAWISLVTFVTWQPFEVNEDVAGERWAALPLIPFVDALQGDPLNAFASLVQKFVLYLPLGALVTTWRPTPSRFTWVPALLCGLGVSVILEAGQLFLPARTATLTDVYVQTFAAVLGSVITRRLCVVERPPVVEEPAAPSHLLVESGKFVW